MENTTISNEKLAIKKKGKLKETIESILVALFFALLIRAFIVQAFKIPSGSMEPTLLVGDYLLVTKFTYGYKFPFINKRVFAFNKPDRGDIVVFKYPVDPDKDFIKRVVGIEGDEILIKDKKLYVNGKPFEVEKAVFRDPVTLPKELTPRDNYGPIKVPKDSLFVMGDNRDSSLDSRFWGFVPIENLRGKAFIIYWSFDSQNGYPFYRLDKKIRFSRIGNLIK
ncbi:MAG: signal peptidase I [Proteobacteria bacterium]|nr:signal peptidase I [Pseudomonadota bacterium]